mgnify:CR=1 FL=1
MKRLKQLPEFVRFVMVGIFATALHYGLYFVLQRVINVNIAYTLGYALLHRQFLSDCLLYLRPEALMEKSLRIWRSTLMQLSATHGVAEPLSLDGHPQTSGPHSGFRHRHSGQLLTRTFRFQKKRVIIL